MFRICPNVSVGLGAMLAVLAVAVVGMSDVLSRTRSRELSSLLSEKVGCD
jgi:hypothetical protein